MRLRIAFVFLNTIPVCGCSERAASPTLPPARVGVVEWTTPVAENANAAATEHAPIDQGSVRYGTWGDEVTFLIWTDITAQTGAGGVGPPRQEARSYSVHWLPSNDHTRVDVSCTTSDGTTGTITIWTKKYNLSRGRFFLLSHKTGRILQLDQHIEEFSSDHKDIRKRVLQLSTKDKQIAEFFAESSTPKNDT